MTRRTHTQLLLGEVVRFGLAMKDPRELMDPQLMARSRYRGPDGTTRTVKWAAIANNLAAIARA